jgi:hypothetical protein
MSRLTGADALGLYEAYQAVYNPQELTEEQVWEEVETWVNSLLEEGYDLSDYTWEEMYESYIEEEQLMERGAPTDPKARAAYDAQVAKNRAALGNTILYGNSAGKKPEAPVTRNRNVPGSRTIKPPAGTPAGTPSSSPIPRMANLGAGYKSAELQQSAAARASQLRTGRTGAGGVSMGGGNAGASVQPAPTKTNTPTATKTAATSPTATKTAATSPAAPRPAATTPAKPSGTTPTAKPTPAPSSSPARPSLSSQASELRQMRARSLERQGKPLSAAVVSATAKPTAYQANSFDPFDVIKGHLLDEGYADTEEAALAIMINMSESWKNSIIG